MKKIAEIIATFIGIFSGILAISDKKFSYSFSLMAIIALIIAVVIHFGWQRESKVQNIVKRAKGKREWPWWGTVLIICTPILSGMIFFVALAENSRVEIPHLYNYTIEDSLAIKNIKDLKVAKLSNYLPTPFQNSTRWCDYSRGFPLGTAATSFDSYIRTLENLSSLFVEQSKYYVPVSQSYHFERGENISEVFFKGRLIEFFESDPYLGAITADSLFIRQMMVSSNDSSRIFVFINYSKLNIKNYSISEIQLYHNKIWRSDDTYIGTKCIHNISECPSIEFIGNSNEKLWHSFLSDTKILSLRESYNKLFSIHPEQPDSAISKVYN